MVAEAMAEKNIDRFTLAPTSFLLLHQKMLQ
jgi:hypothetical protein